ncbi:MAG TPA: hypothetical protein VGP94_01380, partial [Tepidisphaeraceae bacterium]|nr:hypothetical protein [Tepidisphaeraceae bacterium]
MLIAHWSLVILAVAVLSGCGPDKTNILLRKEKQQLQEQIADLQKQVDAARARIAGLESEKGTLPTLPQERLDKLITVQGIKLGRLTGGDPGDTPGAPDKGLKIYLTPVDETAEALKVTGAVEVDAFDLDVPGDNRIGHWTFDPSALKSRWRSLGMLRAFVIECPWQKPPQHSKLAVKVTFRDELTGRVYDQIKEVTVKIPATQPS